MLNRLISLRLLAIVGDVLVWLPLLAPCVFWAVRLLGGRVPVFDYLMPAELFPVAFAGGALLLVAAWLAKTWRAAICWCVGVAAVSLVGSQSTAVVTGLASGATEPTGWPWIAVLSLLALYALALLTLAVYGAALSVRLGRKSQA